MFYWGRRDDHLSFVVRVEEKKLVAMLLVLLLLVGKRRGRISSPSQLYHLGINIVHHWATWGNFATWERLLSSPHFKNLFGGKISTTDDLILTRI